jgi:hypothetical protein
MNTRPRPTGRVVVALAVLVLAAACGGHDGDGGVAGGEACESDSPCTERDSMCFAVGISSTCDRGALCVGTSGKLACSYECASDADCAEHAPSSVCLAACVESLLNGFCVEPSVRDELLSFPFCTEDDGDPTNGLSGSSS